MGEEYCEDLTPKEEEVFRYLENQLEYVEVDNIEDEFPDKGNIAKEVDCSTQTVGKALKKLALKNYKPVRDYMEGSYNRRKSIAAEASRREKDYELANQILRETTKEKRKEGIEEAFRKYL
ncbi:MAG: hypothetical protein ACLFS3_03135 [Candidatus Aenigmatarchaeota archaeon]